MKEYSTERIVSLFLAFLVFTVLVRAHLLKKAALAISSLLLSHFLLFCVLERYPSLINVIHLQNVPYYAIKLCCVGDDKLVFREVPSSGNFYYQGDRYSPVYMEMHWSTRRQKTALSDRFLLTVFIKRPVS